MATVRNDLEGLQVGDRVMWVDGPPLEAFKRMRQECPIHWTPRIEDFPEEAGFWSVTTADDIHAVSRDWQTYSSETGGVTAASVVFPLELTQAMFIGMDPPKHDRLKALFQAGFTPGGSPTTSSGSARSRSRLWVGWRVASRPTWSATSPSPSSPA